MVKTYYLSKKKIFLIVLGIGVLLTAMIFTPHLVTMEKVPELLDVSYVEVGYDKYGVQPIYQVDTLTVEYADEVPATSTTELYSAEEVVYYDDVTMLAQLVQSEAGNQGIDGMRMVADVVLNRVDSPKYPNSIREVIFQRGQFSVTTNGAYDKAGRNLREDSILAAQMEYYAVERLDPLVLYFNNSPNCSGSNHVKIGGHWFGY